MRFRDFAGGMLAVCLGLAGAGAASAQEGVQPAPADSACELHVWPATDAMTGYNMALNPVLQRGVISHDTLLAALPAETQLAALQRLDLAQLLSLPGVRVIAEQEPVHARVAVRQQTRLTPSAASCYAELYVQTIAYRTDPFFGRDFEALFIYRRYAGSATPEVLRGNGKVGLKIFPARREEQREAAREELSAGFGQTFEKFVASRLNRRR